MKIIIGLSAFALGMGAQNMLWDLSNLAWTPGFLWFTCAPALPGLLALAIQYRRRKSA